MTVRLQGVDVSADGLSDAAPTPAEKQVLSAVSALAERLDRPVRLLVVPANDVFAAIVATILRLRSSDVHVGESSTLSADEQARLLGVAWEKAAQEAQHDVRLVVHHRSGRTDTYHIGAHPPSLSPADLDLIHRVWLDATKAIGPHIHHHDVVRAALTQMEQELNGPQRDEALAAIRQTARRADELTPVLRARDYAQLRDMMRNRHASDVASLLTELSIEDQVVVFRVLPRKDAAEVFEYLSQEAKETLLKAMAQEDVAALLNNMAPDDRTMFLEELPATATRELLTLLTPEERGVAMALLGYPERSVGRLMTPNYVAVREHWTVRDVLDHVRKHGHDSETLNVIYVVDEQGLLIDDVRIREFLLAPVDHLVADLMDRRFVALKASDDQEAAVAVFRQYDRSALPVTDTAGMLIGIVTIDDVLDVAEATATREIQRIGGSEALDEPYMNIAFVTHDSEARGLADGAVHRRNADGDGDGRVRGGDFESRRPGAVRAAHHLERRQLGLAGGDARHPRAGARRSRARRLVAGDAPRAAGWPRARRDPRQHRLPAHRPVVGLLRHLRRSTGCSSPSPSRSRWSASCCGAR